MKVSRVKVGMGVLVVGIVALVRYAMRDMRLDVDLLREGLMNMPGLVMENMQLAREVSGDVWHVRVPYLERRGELVAVRSVDVRRQIREGGEWYLFGAEGVYSNDERTACVNGLLGTLEAPARIWNLESPRVLWSEASGDFVFPRGLTLYDDEFLLSAPEASMDRTGVVLLEKGGQLQWTKPLG